MERELCRDLVCISKEREIREYSEIIKIIKDLLFLPFASYCTLYLFQTVQLLVILRKKNSIQNNNSNVKLPYD